MSSEFVTRTTHYYSDHFDRYPGTKIPKRYRWTGEKRPPLKGERYLSGSVVCAYKSFADLSDPYLIAQEVPIESLPNNGKACPHCGRT